LKKLKKNINMINFILFITESSENIKCIIKQFVIEKNIAIQSFSKYFIDIKSQISYNSYMKRQCLIRTATGFDSLINDVLISPLRRIS
jgi:hypothetical protein